MNEFELDSELMILGITPAMCEDCRMPYCEDTHDLVDAGPDMFDRPQKMTAETLNAWENMKRAASRDGIELKLVSAFRSAQYQCEVIANKLKQGRDLEEILTVNAIPGYSEHHTGRALDLHAGDAEPLSISFETEPAFFWLNQNAGQYGFSMSYPKNNAAGITYEPWHWCYQKL